MKPGTFSIMAAGLAVAALTLASASFPAAAAGSDVVAVDSADVELGQSAAVSVSVLHLKTHLNSWTVDVDFNPDVVSAINCSGTEETVCSTSFGPHTARVTGASQDGLRNGAHQFASLVFRCDRAGTSALALDIQVWADLTVGAPSLYPVETRNGSITCIQAPPTETKIPPTTTPAIALPQTGSAGTGSGATWPIAAAAMLGVLAIIAGAGLARRKRR